MAQSRATSQGRRELRRVERGRVERLSDELLGSILEIAEDRRSHTDAQMWQVPVLSLTAQAFLLQLGLGPGTSGLGRLIASLLGLASAVAAVQLLQKHRYHELQLSCWIEQVEKDRSLPQLHARLQREAYSGQHPDTMLTRRRSHRVWTGVLCAFAVADLVLVVLSILQITDNWNPLSPTVKGS